VKNDVHTKCIPVFNNKDDFMPRTTISLPKGVHEKLQNYAEENDLSLSQTIAKMAELGLMVSERRDANRNPENQFSEIEKHCFKLMIQMNGLLKKIAEKQLNYGQDEFKKLADASVDRYLQLMNVYPDGL
jgi:predicted DNA-binding ribbon-helix-helix protein